MVLVCLAKATEDQAPTGAHARRRPASEAGGRHGRGDLLWCWGLPLVQLFMGLRRIPTVNHKDS